MGGPGVDGGGDEPTGEDAAAAGGGGGAVGKKKAKGKGKPKEKLVSTYTRDLRCEQQLWLFVCLPRLFGVGTALCLVTLLGHLFDAWTTKAILRLPPGNLPFPLIFWCHHLLPSSSSFVEWFL